MAEKLSHMFIMSLKGKENVLPHINNDIGSTMKSKRNRRTPLVSTPGNGSFSVSVPKRTELSDPIFHLKGQRMNTKVVMDEQLANKIAMVLIARCNSDLTWDSNNDGYTQQGSDIYDNVYLPNFKRSLTCDGTGLSPHFHFETVLLILNTLICRSLFSVTRWFSELILDSLISRICWYFFSY